MSNVKAIILAAGESKRLKPLTKNKPKCLLKINGITILDHQIKALHKLKADQIIVVVGYQKNMIMEHIKGIDKIIIVENDSFRTTDNAYSAFLALHHVNPEVDSVIILDGDILFDFNMLRRLVHSRCVNAMIVDYRKTIEPEDCKVMIKNGFAVAIGKKVNGQAVYTSMIKMGGTMLKDFITEVGKKRSKTEWYSEPLNRLTRRNNLNNVRGICVISTGNLFRCEIDTLNDLLKARSIYKKLRENFMETAGI